MVWYGIVYFRGFQGHCLKDAVKGPQFEQTKTRIFLNHAFLEESQNDSQKGENRILEIPEPTRSRSIYLSLSISLSLFIHIHYIYICIHIIYIYIYIYILIQILNSNNRTSHAASQADLRRRRRLSNPP